MNKAVIFDLDGTILDSAPDILYNLNLMLDEFGHKRINLQRVYDTIGHGARNLVKGAIDEALSEEEIDARLSFYNQKYTSSGSPYTKLFDGIDELLKSLKLQKFKLAILTNKPQETTDNIYQKYLKNYQFDMVIGQRKDLPIKPNPTSTFQILQSLEVSKENAFFIGDMETDLLTGLNAEITPIIANWGYGKKEKLLSLGAKYFAEIPSEVLSFLK